MKNLKGRLWAHRDTFEGNILNFVVTVRTAANEMIFMKPVKKSKMYYILDCKDEYKIYFISD